MSDAPQLALRCIADVQPRNVRWLIPGLIPLRTLTLVPGIGGLGKSTWLAGVIARLSRGDLGDPGSALVITYEDAAEEVLRPRLEAAGADLNLVHQVVLANDAFGAVQLPRDVEELVFLANEVGAKLIVVDPIVAGIDVALDTHKDQHVRAVLGRLAQLAEDLDCAVVLVAHVNKAPSQEEHIRVNGSMAFWNACRSVVFVGGNKEEPERIIMQRKSNYSRLGLPERHRIEEIVLPGTADPETGEPIITSRMVFVEYAEDAEVASVLGGSQDGAVAEKEREAGVFLLRNLPPDGWHESKPLKEAAEAAGIADRTLKRAKQDLGIEDKREGFPSVSYWRWPQSGQPSPKNDGPTGGSAWTSQERGASAPVGPAANDGPADGPTALPGDDLFPALLAEAVENGHITDAEAVERYEHHKLCALARGGSQP